MWPSTWCSTPMRPPPTAPPGEDRRPRLEHCGAMRPDQYERAAGLGVAVSLFIQHLWYWGDVLVDGLFGPEHGGRWMAVPLRARRRGPHLVAQRRHGHPSRSARQHRHRGRSAGPRAVAGSSVPSSASASTRRCGLRPSTPPGNCSSTRTWAPSRPESTPTWCVLSADPRAVAPEAIGDLEVVATFFDGRQTAGEPLW